MEERRFTLSKEERLCRMKVIEELFSGKNDSFSAYPLRIVFMKTPKTDDVPPVRILISVSKRKFKRAVKRNRVKRQIREAYRKNKYLLSDALSDKDYTLVVAFLWLASELKDSALIEEKLVESLNNIISKL